MLIRSIKVHNCVISFQGFQNKRRLFKLISMQIIVPAASRIQRSFLQVCSVSTSEVCWERIPKRIGRKLKKIQDAWILVIDIISQNIFVLSYLIYWNILNVTSCRECFIQKSIIVWYIYIHFVDEQSQLGP